MQFVKKYMFIYCVVIVYTFILCVDVLLRFSSSPWPYFRAWEYMGRSQAFGSQFIANGRFEKEGVRGELARKAGNERIAMLRKELISTDKYGFRNSNVLYAHAQIPIFVFGDSFMIGAGVEDSQTFPSQLQDVLNLPVCNAATGNIEDLFSGYCPIRTHKPRIVLFGLLEKTTYSLSDRTKKKLSSDTSNNALMHIRILGKRIDHAIDNIKGWFSRPALRRWAMQCKRCYLESFFGALWQNVSTLPVLEATLQNGDAMLFFKPSIKKLSADELKQRRQGVKDYFTALNDACSRNNMFLVVVLIPNKYTIYKPFLKPEDQLDITKNYLELVESDLLEEMVHVVNLTDMFREGACGYYEMGKYIYWQDGTHWNPDGIKIAAQEVGCYINDRFYPQGPKGGLMYNWK